MSKVVDLPRALNPIYGTYEFYAVAPPPLTPDVKVSFADLQKAILGWQSLSAIGFYGATPVTQLSGAAQGAVAATVGAAVAGTGATNTSPFGFTTAAQADDLVARVNQLRADVLALTTLCNRLRGDLVSLGLIKGSA